MSKLNSGSLCLTDLIEQAKKGHSAFTKAGNGKIYVNVLLWDNDELDKYGNKYSMQLNSTKEMKDTEGKIYVGNFKPVEKKEPEPLKKTDLEDLPLTDDLPF